MTESSIEMKDVKLDSARAGESPSRPESIEEAEQPALKLDLEEGRSVSGSDRIKAFSTMFGGFVIMLSCGGIYTLGNISPYITSYYGLADPKSANMIMPTIVFLNCAFVPIGTYLINRNINPKLLILLASLISIPILFVASSTSNFTTFFALYAFAIAFQ